jgi:branched-chain amino acid transport system ATP-binding protein
LLEIKDLYVSYGITEVLRGVSFSVMDGSIVALLGGNGSGKTTTMNTISGFLIPRAGSIKFQGREISGIPTDHIVKLGIVQVPQGREIFSGLTVQENLEMGAVTRKDKDVIKKDMDEFLHQFPVLKERRQQKAGYLSGGEQQMLCIARALMAKPKLLLMDEPTAGLSPIIAQEIMGVIKHLNEEGKTILLVEHNVGLSLELSNIGFVLKDGKIAITDKSENLRENPEIIKSYLGG